MNSELTREILGNIDAISRLVFYTLAFFSLACFGFGVWLRVRRWRLRREITTSHDWSKAARRVWTLAMLQRKVRSGRSGAGVAHAALFLGFCLLFVGTVLVAIEHYGAGLLGRPATDPIFHKGLYFALFELTLDIGGVLLLGGCVYFVWRRKQGGSSIGHQCSDWLVVGSLILLGFTGYMIEGARILIEDTPMPGFSPVGLLFANLFEVTGPDGGALLLLHKAAWWVHAVAALGFIAAIPYCRLLHIVAGMTNLALRDYELGAMSAVSIEEVERLGSVGLGKARELNGAQLLALDACVSCGRCQDACPAFAAGKPLSPRDVVQDLRRFTESLGFDVLAHPKSDDGDSLHGDLISPEALWACTTCGACVERCPLDVAPLEFITDMRRFLVGEGELSGPPAAALQKMQRAGNPWGLPAGERFDWAEGLSAPTVKENPGFEILYWVGCSASYDPRIRKVARAVVQLMQAAGVNFACLGPGERCTGDSARRMGDEFLFQELAMGNIETLNCHGVHRIVTHCPHCLNSLTKDYSQFGGAYAVVHHSQLLAELINSGKLKVTGSAHGAVTYHDPCYLARANDITEQPRAVLSASRETGASGLIELPRNRCGTGCCGGGGGRMWFDDKAGERAGGDRIDEIVNSKAVTVAVSCPFCLTMIGDGLAARSSDVAVKDIAELLAESVGKKT